MAAVGADHGLCTLTRAGLIREAGTGLSAVLVVDEAKLVELRRALMTRDAGAVALLQRAGESWAAFASTAANTSAIAPDAVVGAVTSATA
jgi:hypothetical protein